MGEGTKGGFVKNEEMKEWPLLYATTENEKGESMKKGVKGEERERGIL
jgi:hypothetical protein